MTAASLADAAAADAPEEVACDLCGGRDLRVRYRLGRGNLASCRACGLTFVTPRLPARVLGAKLQAWAVQDTVDSDRLAIAFEPATMALYRTYLAELERRAGHRGTLLDVGCATGAFLVAAREAGWDGAGLELGHASAGFARERHGLRVTCASLYDHDAGAGSQDAIACLEVVEHLPSPLSALRRLHGWLKPGGMLLLSTPNFDSLYRRLFGTRWWVVNCEDEHIVLFTRATLAAALRQAGFEVVENRTRSIDYPGLWHQLRGTPAPGPQAGPEAHGYYDARGRKARIKQVLARTGLLGAARGLLRAQDRLLALPAVPALGEQLVVLARKPAPSASRPR